METIFAHNPTPSELLELTGKSDCTEKDYLKDRSFFALLDIALLWDIREENAEANKYWEQIPELAQEYRLGFDDLLLVKK